MLAVAGGIAYAHEVRHQQWRDRLVRTLPNDVPEDPALVAFARAEAAPIFAQHCAACHGADMRGNPAIGAPSLADNIWLYGDGGVFEIERTILYGIRTGNSKSRSVTDMPAFGQRGVLNDADIRNVVQYVLKLSGRRYQVEAANEGRRVYTGNANCGDCHAGDARGDTYYGAPNLTANVWNSGGEPDDLYKAIYFGQHRSMQAWFPTLSLFQIRALAVYLYAVAREPAAATRTTLAARSAQ
ncbi:MAG TPA: c-type cytochrome [Gammaproteobacteria bacterium]|nr:c-type cytochrome [Gammaproteobacteria bacterium]